MTLGDARDPARPAGSARGGFNFDAKLRRQSIDRTDLFHAHIGGMDTLARALLAAASIIEAGELDAAPRERYAGWDGELGRSILDGTRVPGVAPRADHRYRRTDPRLRSPGGSSRTSSPAISPAPPDVPAGRVEQPARRGCRFVDHRHQGRGARARQRPDRRARPRRTRRRTRRDRSKTRPRGGGRSRRPGSKRVRRDVAAISVAGQQHGMVALDEHRRVIRPAKLWNDTESAPDAKWLIAELAGGSQAWADACGVVPVASITITKLSWLHRSEPEAWKRLAHVLLPHDWLTLQLTGRLATDRGDASGTGYWSAAAGTYRFDLLAMVDGDRDWTSAVPPVLGPHDVAGEWRGAHVGPGTGDNMAGALGVGLRPGDVAVSIGTSGTVYAVSDTPTADPSGIVAGFRRRLRPVPPARLHPQRHEGHRRGRRPPRHRPCRARRARARRASRSRWPQPAPVPRRRAQPEPSGGHRRVVGAAQRRDPRAGRACAAVEGVVCGLLDGLDALGSFAPVGRRLLIVGGGAHSQAYRRVLADLSGRAVLVPRGDQQVATGACVQAAAVVTGAEPADIADRWGLGEGARGGAGPGNIGRSRRPRHVRRRSARTAVAEVSARNS